MTSKTIASLALGFLLFGNAALAASEYTGTLSSRSTQSMTEYEGTLVANTNGQAVSQSSTGGGGGGGGGSGSGGSGGSGGSIASNDTSATDRIIIVPEAGLTGTGGGFDPTLERFLAASARTSAEGGTGGPSESPSGASSEELLALNAGPAAPTFLGGDQPAAAASTGLGTGTIALIALGTIALVGAIGYGVNAALGMRRIDRL